MSIQVKDANNVTQTVETPAAVGQALMAASKPVAIASNQSAVPVSGTVTANAGTGTMTIGGTVAISTLPTTPAGTNNIGDVDIVTMPAITGTVSVSSLPTIPAGTNNIGDVDVLTMPAITGSVSVSSLPTLPAGTNNIGDVDIVTMPNVTVNGIPTTALTRAAGAADANTQRVTIDTGQVGSLVRSSVPVVTGGYKYQSVAASTTATLQATTGVVGDYLETLVCIVSTPATSGVLIGDGVTPATTVLPDNVAGGVGTYHIALGILSTAGSWRVTTHAGVSVFATGNWT